MARRLSKQTQLRSYHLPNVKETGRILGKGAFGVVVEMKLPDGTIVTGKKIHDLLLGEGSIIPSQFEQECLIMSQLNHSNIVQFLGVHYKSGSDIPILIMEYLPMSLTNYVEQNETIPNHIKNSILLDVSHGLLYLHTQTPPVSHCDLTANNVLLTSDMKAKITNFIVSCIFQPESGKHYMRMDTCPGTMVYMPPEALQSDYTVTIDNFDKLDVFSFGVLILHIYTQQWPLPTDAFDEHNMPRTEIQRRQHLLDKVEDDTMKQLAMECLHNDPQYRPHTRDLVIRIEDISSVLRKAPGHADLCRLLATINHKWYEIGLAFSISVNVLEGLYLERDSNIRKLSQVISTWIDTKSSPITWETVISAIEGPIVNNKNKADEIRDYLTTIR